MSLRLPRRFFAFPPQLTEESSGKIRLKKWFLCFLSFPLRLTKERSPAKYPVKNKGAVKKKSGRIATRPELPAMKQKENVMA
ncbi:hypothetical protein [Bacteroides fragilis]|uniref:hypothetical protein n=1 Tax=Bacteroides fragilis TaxID=817 RepID=UPI00202F1905|nr:hypothetical protein [Bacteroides fragilis]MCM0219029.1 hypothetical protein [Bacteroides fragilis]MCM0267557.1 hypothetical protein [Bacteroides fragilis]